MVAMNNEKRRQLSLEGAVRIAGLALRFASLLREEFTSDNEMVSAYIRREQAKIARSIAETLGTDLLEQILVDGIQDGTVTGKAADKARAYFDALRYVKECDTDLYVPPDTHVDRDGTILLHGVRTKIEKPWNNRLENAKSRKRTRKAKT